MSDNPPVVIIEGYASIFHQRDLNGDIVAPGAFKKSLAQSRAPLPMLYQHAAEAPIGRWLSFVEDNHGLYGRGEILLTSSKGRDVHALIAGGVLDGLSIGYRAIKSAAAERGGRRILEAELWEVSVVTFPMAPSARILRLEDGDDDGVLLSDLRRARSALSPHLGSPLSGRLRAMTAEGRASVSPSADVRQFAGALRSAAKILNPASREAEKPRLGRQV